MSFEDRLAVELRDLVAARAEEPAAPSRRAARLRIAVSGTGIGAVLVFVLLAVGVGGVSPSAAYAVQTRDDGRVRVVIHDLRDAAGLQHALRAAGVPAEVDYHPDPLPTCPDSMASPPAAPEGETSPPQAVVGTPVKVRTEGRGADRTTTFVVNPAAIPGGQHLEVVALDRDIDEASVTVGISPQGHRLVPVCAAHMP